MRISDWSSDVCSSDLSGILVYQNTYIGEIQQITPASNLHFRNNLIMGTKARPALLAIDTHTPWSSSDYNGFYVNRSEERRVGKECVSTCRSWWSSYH